MTDRSDYVVFGRPLIEDAEVEEVAKSMRAAWLGTGPKVAEFQRRVAAYKGVSHALAVSSCTAGLHLACIAIGLKPGDEVIVPAMTFCATVNAVIHAGATPVLADVDRETFLIDPADVIRRITPRTKAIIVVHFAGRACDMDTLTTIARDHNVRIIEDCAHAIETEHEGRKAGVFGECGVLSFYATKNIVTGEGGMVLTNDEQLASRIKRLALHGLSEDAWKRFSDDGYKHYDVVEIGYKYNMTDLQAAIGMHQIERVDRYWMRRQHVWRQYDEAFADLPVTLPVPPSRGSRHALHLYTLLIEPSRAPVTRDQFIGALHRRGVGTGVHYRAIPEYSAYQKRFGWVASDYPNAQAIGHSTVSIPLSASLRDSDIQKVIEAVRDVLSVPKPAALVAHARPAQR